MPGRRAPAGIIAENARRDAAEGIRVMEVVYRPGHPRPWLVRCTHEHNLCAGWSSEALHQYTVLSSAARHIDDFGMEAPDVR